MAHYMGHFLLRNQWGRNSTVEYVFLIKIKRKSEYFKSDQIYEIMFFASDDPKIQNGLSNE